MILWRCPSWNLCTAEPGGRGSRGQGGLDWVEGRRRDEKSLLKARRIRDLQNQIKTYTQIGRHEMGCGIKEPILALWTRASPCQWPHKEDSMAWSPTGLH